MKPLSVCALSVALLSLAGCAAGAFDSSRLPKGSAAYEQIPPPDPSVTPADYQLGPLDKVSVFVFQEPDLSMSNVPIDSSGNLSYPLVGQIKAEGMTTQELSRELASRFSARYLVNPQVTVTLQDSVSRTVSVEGEVQTPGVYQLPGRSTTLISALAMAKSPTATAKLDQVVVFRMVNGERMAAVFNLSHIRGGKAPDPEILPGDKVVVGFSALRGAWRDLLSMTPLFNVFRRW